MVIEGREERVALAVPVGELLKGLAGLVGFKKKVPEEEKEEEGEAESGRRARNFDEMYPPPPPPPPPPHHQSSSSSSRPSQSPTSTISLPYFLSTLSPSALTSSRHFANLSRSSARLLLSLSSFQSLSTTRLNHSSRSSHTLLAKIAETLLEFSHELPVFADFHLVMSNDDGSTGKGAIDL